MGVSCWLLVFPTTRVAVDGERVMVVRTGVGAFALWEHKGVVSMVGVTVTTMLPVAGIVSIVCELQE